MTDNVSQERVCFDRLVIEACCLLIVINSNAFNLHLGGRSLWLSITILMFNESRFHNSGITKHI